MALSITWSRWTTVVGGIGLTQAICYTIPCRVQWKRLRIICRHGGCPLLILRATQSRANRSRSRLQRPKAILLRAGISYILKTITKCTFVRKNPRRYWACGYWFYGPSWNQNPRRYRAQVLMLESTTAGRKLQKHNAFWDARIAGVREKKKTQFCLRACFTYLQGKKSFEVRSSYIWFAFTTVPSPGCLQQPLSGTISSFSVWLAWWHCFLRHSG